MGLAVQISAAPRRSMQPFSKEGQASCLWAGGEHARPTRAQGRLLRSTKARKSGPATRSVAKNTDSVLLVKRYLLGTYQIRYLGTQGLIGTLFGYPDTLSLSIPGSGNLR